MYIDFSGAVDKYNLDTNDIGFLNNFFNKPENIEKLDMIEKKRKKLNIEMYVVIGLFIVIVSIVAYFFRDKITDLLNQEDGGDDFRNIAYLLVFLLVGYLSLVKKRFNQGLSVKNSILPSFVKDLDQSINYSYAKDLFSEPIDQVYQKTGLLEPYDDINTEEDSIKYALGYSSENKDNHSIELEGVELETSSGQGKKKKTSNHCYITKIVFLEPRFVLKSAVTIKKNNRSLGLFGLFKNKKKIVMENVEFEKMFDVFSEDQVESRMLVNPALMIRLLDFYVKTGNVYEFFFKDNEVYIKCDVPKNYMEFSLYRNVFANTIDYIGFYKEIKIIKSFVKDLGLFYYDKGTFSQVNINNMS